MPKVSRSNLKFVPSLGPLLVVFLPIDVCTDSILSNFRAKLATASNVSPKSGTSWYFLSLISALIGQNATISVSPSKKTSAATFTETK